MEDSPIKFLRGSLNHMLSEIEARGPGAQGVLTVIMDRDGKGSFMISGFGGPMDCFVAAGMLDWVKADLLHDLLDHPQS